MKRIKVGEDEPVEVPFTTRERALILDHTFADPQLTDPLRTATLRQAKLLARLTLYDIEELCGYIAAEANHTKDKGLQRELLRAAVQRHGVRRQEQRTSGDAAPQDWNMKALKAALAYFRAYDARDWDTLRGLLADPIHAELNGIGSDLSVEDYVSGLLMTYNSYPDLHTTIDHAFAHENSAAVQWRAVGTNSGPRQLLVGSTLEATGRRIALGGCDVIRIDETGRIVSVSAYWDMTTWLCL